MQKSKTKTNHEKHWSCELKQMNSLESCKGALNNRVGSETAKNTHLPSYTSKKHLHNHIFFELHKRFQAFSFAFMRADEKKPYRISTPFGSHHSAQLLCFLIQDSKKTKTKSESVLLLYTFNFRERSGSTAK
jgi:hypothetical protein